MAYTSNKNKKVNVQYLQDIAQTYRKSKSTMQTVDIISFAQAQWGLNINLFPVQRFILKTFYGLPLDNNEKNILVPDEMNIREIGRFTEEGFMDFLIETGRTNLKEYIPGTTRRQLILCCGRRAGKTSIASIISNYQVYRLLKMSNPQAYFGFPNGSEIAVCTTSVSQQTASTLFTVMKNYCLNCNFLKDKVVNRSREYFTLATQNDLSNGADPSIFLICGGARSSSIRGHSNIVVIMDEAAFFPTSGQGNGDHLYQALTPSILSFTRQQEDGTRKGQGKVILLSSPYGKTGIFYKKYLESFDFSESMLMYNMYTCMINPTVDSSVLKDEKKRNPSLFDCQYGAKFSDTVASWIDENTLSKVINEKLPINVKNGKRGVEYYMGIDYAGKNDGAALSIIHKQNNKIIVDYSDVYYGSQSDVWWENHNKTYDTANKLFIGYDIIPLEGFADEIKRLNQIFPIKYGWFDQFNGYGLLQMLKQRGLYQFEMKSINNGLNMQMYQYAKEMICSELIELPNHPILVPQILTLEESKNGQKFSVNAPNRNGFHDDIIDSLVISINALSEYDKGGKKNAKSFGAGTGNNYSAASGHGYSSYHRNKYKIHGMNDKRGLY